MRPFLSRDAVDLLRAFWECLAPLCADFVWLPPFDPLSLADIGGAATHTSNASATSSRRIMVVLQSAW
jgi:hypothetical protein